MKSAEPSEAARRAGIVFSGASSSAAAATEAEPSAGDLAGLADTLEELGVSYVMAEPIISSGLAETLAGEVGAELLTLHPLASLAVDEADRGEDYFSLMDTNLDNLRTALDCAK